MLENISGYQRKQLYRDVLDEQNKMTVKDILQGNIMENTIFYIPHTQEIIHEVSRLVAEDMAER